MTTVKKLEFEGMCFELRFRAVKYSRIEFGSGTLVMIVPFGTNPLDILKRKKNTILAKHAKMKKQIAEAQLLPLYTRSEMKFKGMVDQYVKQYSGQLNIKYKVIKYRKMKRRWGSCRSDGFITLNRCLKFLPARLIAYIVFHELVHIIIPGHNKKFKTIIFTQFPGYRELEKELKLYGHKLLL